MQVEGERTKAQVSAKEIESFFKTCLLLGSRVQVINTATTKWASTSKGRRALKEGMTTQIVLNEKLLCSDLDDTNVFGRLGGPSHYYLLELLMNMKSIHPVSIKGEMKLCPLFHSCCPRSDEETPFFIHPTVKKKQKMS